MFYGRMRLPEHFTLTITGYVGEARSRSNISPGELGRLLQHFLNGGEGYADDALRSWGLSMTLTEHVDSRPPPAMRRSRG